MIATILSAQCTDKRVNMVTPELFRRWPDAAALAGATQRDLEAVIRSTGFFRAKAKSLHGCAQALVDRHGGEVPQTIEELVRLPGVGRKTANVVLGTAFGIASGVVVDTHVGRISRRLGLTRAADAVRAERDPGAGAAPGSLDRVQPPAHRARPWRLFGPPSGLRRLLAPRPLSACRCEGAGLPLSCRARLEAVAAAPMGRIAVGGVDFHAGVFHPFVRSTSACVREPLMILSGNEIRQQLGRNVVIEPFDDSRLNPNSYNLSLHDELLVYEEVVLDMRKSNRVERITIPEDGLVLTPNQLYLGRTVERTETHNLVPMIEGRSSIGRLGLFVHVTAGFGDVGFCGYWTLEMFAVQPVKIYPGVPICQIFFHQIHGDITEYSSEKYQHNHDIQPSLLYREFAGDGETSQQLQLEFERDAAGRAAALAELRGWRR